MINYRGRMCLIFRGFKILELMQICSRRLMILNIDISNELSHIPQIILNPNPLTMGRISDWYTAS